MAIILMLVLFGLFLGIEYIRRDTRIAPGRAITGYSWPGYTWTGAYAQDGGEPYQDPLERDLQGLFGEGI